LKLGCQDAGKLGGLKVGQPSTRLSSSQAAAARNQLPAASSQRLLTSDFCLRQIYKKKSAADFSNGLFKNRQTQIDFFCAHG
jgi:hypothetical protein